MRILVVHSFYRVQGGEDAFVARETELLRAYGHDVRLETRDNAALPRGATTAIRFLGGGHERARIRAVLAQYRPDVVHVHNPYPSFGPAVHRASRAAGIPLVQTAHNARLRCPNGLMFTEGAVCRRCVHGAYYNAVVHDCFPSRAQAAAYASSLWTHRFLLRTDDDVDTFVAPSAFVERRLRSWGIPSDRIALVRHFTATGDRPVPVGGGGLFIGRLSSEKGVGILLRALATVGDPPFEIVGDGPDARQLHGVAYGLRLHRTRFLGRLGGDDLEAAFKRARYVVMPSLSEETAGLAGLEAMARGRPLVASDLGALTELVQGGGGRLCAGGDVESLAAAMTTYVGDAAVAQTDGAAAFSFVQRECSPAQHLSRLMAAYAQASNVSLRDRVSRD